MVPRIEPDSDRPLTPALVIDAQAVDANIEATIAALGGDAGRWRPHIKTAKLAWTIERLLAHGVHAYDGHLGFRPPGERRTAVHAALDRVAALAERLTAAGIRMPLITTSGSLTFVDAVGHAPLARLGVRHHVCPGTVVYFDLTSERHLGLGLGHRAAATVMSRVISATREGWITCDAGHKAVSADAGVPTCAVAGRADLEPGTPSEEHLPIHGAAGLPALGDLLALVPRHVCPTVNLFDSAILVDAGRAPRVLPVTARGREARLG